MSGLRPERAAEIIAKQPDGTVVRGSGYLVATGLVLTAGHAVRDAVAVKVRFEADRPTEFTAPGQVVWLSRGRSDAALLALDSESADGARSDEPVLFGTLPEDDAELPGSALGFPWFKLQKDPADGSWWRDASHVHGWLPALSNRRGGTLQFRVPPPERHPDPLRSPWEGMSGAAVWSQDRVVGIVIAHHPREGLGSLTVSRADSWGADSALERDGDSAGAVDERRARALRQAGLDRPPDLVGPGDSHRVTAGYLAEIRSFAPQRLLDREHELAELARFAERSDGYWWWQAPPWHGKTALAAWFAAHPPPAVAVAAHFVTRRIGGHGDSDGFARSMAEQLAAIAQETAVFGTAAGAPTREFHRLLDAAARRQRRHGRRLLLVVDGLDEDEVAGGPYQRPSIASLLPRHLPDGVSALITSRFLPALPLDVPGDHPLRAGTPRALAGSAHAGQLRSEAEYELGGLLDHTGPCRDLAGLLVATGGGLDQDELAELMATTADRVAALLSGDFGRILSVRETTVFHDGIPAPRRERFFAHDTLRATALERLAADLPRHRESVARWAASYRDRHWPDGTPHYLLTGYGQLVLAEGEPDAVARVLADTARHDRMSAVLLGDGPAIAELAAARRLLAERAGTLPGTVLRLATAHHRLTGRSSGWDNSGLALLRGRLGQVGRARVLVEAMPEGPPRIRALARLAAALVDEHPRHARELARHAADLMFAKVLPALYPSAYVETAVQIGRTLLRLDVPEGVARLHQALALVAEEQTTGSDASQDSPRTRLIGSALGDLAEAFGSAGDEDGVRAVWSAARGVRQGRSIAERAMTGAVGDGHGRGESLLGQAAHQPDTGPSPDPAFLADLRAALPPALAAAGHTDDAWRALEDVARGRRDEALAGMREAFATAGRTEQALRAARAVGEAAARRQALLGQAQAMPDATTGLQVVGEACPHPLDGAAWPCGGACAALRVRALGKLGRWEEARSAVRSAEATPFRTEVRRQLLTALAQAGCWARAEEVLARYRAEEEPEAWLHPALTLMCVGDTAGDPRAVRLAEDLLALPRPLAQEDKVRLDQLATPVLARRGRWTELAAYYESEPDSWSRDMSLLAGAARSVVEDIAVVLESRPDRVEEALELFAPLFSGYSWQEALASASAERGQWLTAARMARGIGDPHRRRTALTRMAAAIAGTRHEMAARLADEAEAIVAMPGTGGPASLVAGRQQILLAFAEALAEHQPAFAAGVAEEVVRRGAHGRSPRGSRDRPPSRDRPGPYRQDRQRARGHGRSPRPPVAGTRPGRAGHRGNLRRPARHRQAAGHGSPSRREFRSRPRMHRRSCRSRPLRRRPHPGIAQRSAGLGRRAVAG